MPQTLRRAEPRRRGRERGRATVHVGLDGITGPEPLRELGKLFGRTDARIATIVERGAAQRLYARSVKVPRLIVESDQLVSPGRERYVAVKS